MSVNGLGTASVLSKGLGEIPDITKYNLAMRQSLLDKIYFADKINGASVIVDYGCADGQLIHFLRMIFPEWFFYGYDISREMVELAKKNNPGVSFEYDWKEISTALAKHKTAGQKCVLLLSSIIHEVYSYGTAEEIEKFWQIVFGGTWDYIVIRDMIPSNAIDRPSDINDVAKILRKADKRLYEFQSEYGTIESNKTLVHYLLKYRYTDNWPREVKENYLPLSREKLLSSLPDNYEISYHEHYILPFVKQQVKADFGIELKDNTHLKLILEKKEK